MALLDRFKGKDGQGEASNAGMAFDSAKAEKFYSHARTAFETGRYEYAMQLWLQGLKQNPDDLGALGGFFAAASAYISETPKGMAKDARKTLSGSGKLDKFAVAILDCGLKQLDANLRVKAAEISGELGLSEVTRYLGEAGMRLALNEKKPRKDHFMKLRVAFERAGSYDLAVQAAQKTVELDPSDRELADELRNMMAQAAMSQGGFDNSEEGGYRKNIRNADKQRKLEEGDRVVKTEDAKKRVLKAAYEEYQLRPNDIPTILKLLKALRDMGVNKYDREAWKLANKAYNDTEQFQFREQAGDLQMKMARTQIRELEAAHQENPDDEDIAQRLKSARESLADLEISEMELRVQNYPTDLPRKYDLAQKLAEVGRHEEAIPLLQVAKEDSRNRLRSMKLLAECFLKTDFAEGAEQTYRDALGRIEDENSEIALELRYGLMVALHTKGEQDRDVDAIGEAADLANAIAIQKFNYRDVRERRDALKALLAELRG